MSVLVNRFLWKGVLVPIYIVYERYPCHNPGEEIEEPS